MSYTVKPLNGMHEQRTLHGTAAEHNEKDDNPTGNWHSERALEYADHAYKPAKGAHNKSGRTESF